MSIPIRLKSYLEHEGARYEVSAHHYSRSSAETARTARVSPHALAKSVILEDEAGCVMAVVPADKDVDVDEIADMLGRRRLQLASEDRLATLFADCERGAVPPLGMAWGLETLVDDELEDSEEIYLEAGDHERLIKVSRAQFQRLMGPARHGSFCRTTVH